MQRVALEKRWLQGSFQRVNSQMNFTPNLDISSLVNRINQISNRMTSCKYIS